MKIKVLITGGTIDKTYKELSGELSFTETHMVDMLNRGRSMTDTLSEVLFLKDSLDMENIDRQLILDACLQTSANKLVITHGTDTMTETASLLSKNIEKLENERKKIYNKILNTPLFDSKKFSSNLKDELLKIYKKNTN